MMTVELGTALRISPMGADRSPAIPRRRLTVDRERIPDFYGFLSMTGVWERCLLDNAKVFHRISLSRLIDSSPLRLRPFFLLTGWFMTHRLDVARGRDIVARWCALAEQRLEHLTELFETGRWRRYHSELAFLENIQEAKAAVEIWRDLSLREASRDNSAVDISWLGRSRATLPRGEMLRDQVHRLPPQPAQIPAEPPPSDVSIAAGTDRVCSDEAPSAPDSAAPALDNASELTLDMSAMQERYPLLRNAL
jgi:uncharacterized repeat protein (TIGR03809 family)